jgi:hypothetical protein
MVIFRPCSVVGAAKVATTQGRSLGVAVVPLTQGPSGARSWLGGRSRESGDVGVRESPAETREATSRSWRLTPVGSTGTVEGRGEPSARRSWGVGDGLAMFVLGFFMFN